MSEGVIKSSVTSKNLFLGFGFNRFFKSVPGGMNYFPFTTQSLTKPPLILQLNLLISIQQTAIILLILLDLTTFPFLPKLFIDNSSIDGSTS
jgi:hypothetical protein